MQPGTDPMGTTKVLLADDHALLRGGLKSLLERDEEVRVVGEAGDGRTAVLLTRELEPDVVIMDVAMPELNGIEATRQIRADGLRVKVVGLSMHCNRRLVVEMLRAGACAYVLKLNAFDEVRQAVKAAVADQSYLSPGVARLVVDELVNPELPKSAYAALTPREREVLQLLTEGRSSKEIASALCIGARTVDTHRKSIMSKLQLGSVAELTRYAVREGLVELEG